MAVGVPPLVIVDEDGNERPLELSSKEFNLVIDGDELSPTVTSQVEIDKGRGEDTDQLTDQCGNTERFRTSDSGWALTATGFVTRSNRDANLGVREMKAVADMESVQVETELHSEDMTVQNVRLTQVSDVAALNTESTSGDELAFEFEIQLGDQQSSNEE